MWNHCDGEYSLKVVFPKDVECKCHPGQKQVKTYNLWSGVIFLTSSVTSFGVILHVCLFLHLFVRTLHIFLVMMVAACFHL